MRDAIVKVLALAFFSIGLACSGSLAEDQNAHLSAAREVIEAVHIDATFKALLPNILAQIRNLLAQQNPSVAKDLDEMTPRLLAKVLGRLDELKAQFAEVYAARLSETELREILAFYKTPTGAKLIALQPEFAQQGMALGRAWGETLAKEVTEEMKSELRKRGHNI